ncbi:MAG TPA: hypothetical protein PKA19_06635 [Bacillota bacterium]|nr:hypothetical protein [Bacillota bacterium]
MKKIRTIACFLAAALVAASFAGCGADKTAASNSTPSKQEQNGGQQAFHGGKGTIAKVVSLNGDQLTVVLADRTSNNRGGTPPAIDGGPGGGGTPPAIDGKPDSVAPTSGAAVDGTGAPPKTNGAPDGDQSRSGQQKWDINNLKFTGEEVIYNLSGDVTVMKGTGDSAKAIDLSDLAAGDVIRFTTVTADSGDETIDTIVVMNE